MKNQTNIRGITNRTSFVSIINLYTKLFSTIKLRSNRAKEFYANVQGYAGKGGELEAALKHLHDILQEADSDRLDFATEEFFHESDGFKMQSDIDKVLHEHTSCALRLYDMSSTETLCIFANYDSFDTFGAVAMYATEGTPRRLLAHDMFMAVIQGRANERAREFFENWFGAHFDDDGAMHFDEPWEDSYWFNFWFGMKAACAAYPFDKACTVEVD